MGTTMTAFCNIGGILDLSEKIFNRNDDTNINNAHSIANVVSVNTLDTSDIYRITGIIITFILSMIIIFYISKLKKDTKEKMIAFSIMSYVRNKMLFVKSFEKDQYSNIPGWTEEQKWEHSPSGGIFYAHLKVEYENTRKLIQQNLKNKTILEIDELIKEYYPNDFIKKLSQTK